MNFKHAALPYTYTEKEITTNSSIEVKEIENIALDFAESHLHTQIGGGNTSATIFYLKTKGKNRGYVERQEITGADGMPTKFEIEIIHNSFISKFLFHLFIHPKMNQVNL